MARVKNVSMKPAFVCDRCGYGYWEARDAVSCEEHCKRDGAPSAVLTKKAFMRPAD